MKKINAVSLLLTAIILSACGAGRAIILEPVKVTQPITGVTIKRDVSSVNVNAEVLNDFEKELRSKLNDAGFKENSDLTLSYRFIQLDEGNRFARWFVGGFGNAGEGSMMTEVKYYDAQNKEIGKIHAEGKIGSGMYGGGFSNAIEKAVESIVDYTSSVSKK